MRRILAIVNPFAAGGTDMTLIKSYIDFLEKDASLAHSYYLTQKAKDFDGMEEAINSFNPDIISILGGDGTINDVLNVPSARRRTFHLIPSGSGNDFSRLINGSMHIHDTFSLIYSNNRVKCDTGICNGTYFLNGVGIGFDGAVARQTVFVGGRFTRMKYWIAIFKNILFYRSSQVRLKFNETVKEDQYFMISVANGKEYGGGFRVSPLSDPSDGLLNLVAINKIHPLKRLFYLPVLERGRHLNLSFVAHHEIKQIELSSPETLYAHLDGELMNGNHFEIRVADPIWILGN